MLDFEDIDLGVFLFFRPLLCGIGVSSVESSEAKDISLFDLSKYFGLIELRSERFEESSDELLALDSPIVSISVCVSSRLVIISFGTSSSVSSLPVSSSPLVPFLFPFSFFLSSVSLLAVFTFLFCFFVPSLLSSFYLSH